MSLGARSASSVAESVVASATEKAETLAPTAGGAAVSLTRREPRGKRLDPAEAPSAAVFSATAIEGDGDYLHLASRGKVATTMRGNPFVVAWESLSPGGRVAAMAAQPVGGGAYTRQYVYLFTDRGITALTHDTEGRHRNTRRDFPVGGQEPSPGGFGRRGCVCRRRGRRASSSARLLREDSRPRP